MGTIAEKLQYTNNAVNDIKAAINEKGVTIDNTVELANYGDKIRKISGDESWLQTPRSLSWVAMGTDTNYFANIKAAIANSEPTYVFTNLDTNESVTINSQFKTPYRLPLKIGLNRLQIKLSPQGATFINTLSIEL